MTSLASITAWSVGGTLLLCWFAPWAIGLIVLLVVARAVYMDEEPSGSSS